jgi:hypothetical protein
MMWIKKVGKAFWNFMLAVGEARAQRDLMHMQAIQKHKLGR